MTTSNRTPPPAAGDGTSRRQLAALRAEFPCFRIWREETCDRARYVARSLHPGLNPHTVMTDDMAELRAALEPASATIKPCGSGPGTAQRKVQQRVMDATTAWARRAGDHQAAVPHIGPRHSRTQ
jgi:hypothetical protein